MPEKKEVKTSKQKTPRTWISRKPDNPTEGKRVKASPTFLPSHWAAIEADGRKLTVCLDEALAFWIAQKQRPQNTVLFFPETCETCGKIDPCNCWIKQ